ncbi:unnamed protein product [marine sediment metagenome]|uniref:Uncharacterized protein n=1 Tax=marine sediment metagenome TaxID=412755 RepID=X1RFT0_9ZZZZ
MVDKKDSKKAFDASLEKIKELAKVPKCNIEFRDDGKAYVVCDTKADQKMAYGAIIEGVIVEVKPEVKKVE